jgi:hypothetical protein
LHFWPVRPNYGQTSKCIQRETFSRRVVNIQCSMLQLSARLTLGVGNKFELGKRNLRFPTIYIRCGVAK